MVENQLTANEIDDLLSVFKGGARGAQALSEVESLDLERPNRIPKGTLETLAIRHEQAARAVGQGLRAVLGCNLDLSLRRLEQERFQNFRDRQEEPCCGLVVDLKPLRYPGYLVMDFGFAFACVDRLLGGSGEPDGQGRDLTPTEESVLADVVEVILSSHAAVWERYMKLTPSIRKSVSVPRFMRDVRGEDAILTAEYRLSGFADGFGFRFAVPLPGLEGLLQYRGDCAPEGQEETHEFRQELEDHLVDVALDVSVRIGQAEIPVRDVLGLEAGDVVILDRDVGSRLDLLVEGHPKFNGRLVRRGRRLVFQVDDGPEAKKREGRNAS